MTRPVLVVALLFCVGCHIAPIQVPLLEPTSKRYQDTVAVKAQLISCVHVAIGTIQETRCWREAIAECRAAERIPDCAEEDLWIDGPPIPYVQWSR